MKKKKVLQVLVWFLALCLVICLAVAGYAYYFVNTQFMPQQHKKATHRVGYIDPETALLSNGFETCSNYIFDYYNPERATYSTGKNGLRKFVMNTYVNRNVTASGYVSIRFVINCKGEAGRYTIHQTNLDLEATKISEALVTQLFNITTQLKVWNPNVIRGKAVDSYMYILYRIEHGEITQIIP